MHACPPGPVPAAVSQRAPQRHETHAPAPGPKPALKPLDWSAGLEPRMCLPTPAAPANKAIRARSPSLPRPHLLHPLPARRACALERRRRAAAQACAPGLAPHRAAQLGACPRAPICAAPTSARLHAGCPMAFWVAGCTRSVPSAHTTLPTAALGGSAPSAPCPNRRGRRPFRGRPPRVGGRARSPPARLNATPASTRSRAWLGAKLPQPGLL